MKITIHWLKEKNACSAGVQWFLNQKETDVIKVLNLLIGEHRLDWANWTISQALYKHEKTEYAIYAAKLVISLFEEKYPNDNRPRKAIEAAEMALNFSRSEIKNAANAAYGAAYDAANAAYAAVNAAANAVAYAAAYAAVNAAAYDAAISAANKMKIKIINYGIKLLKNEKSKEK